MLQGANLVARPLASTREDEDRAGRSLGSVADLVEELDRVHVGQLEVEQREVRQMLARESDALGAAVGDQYFVARPREDAHRQRCQFGVVLDHQDPSPRSPHAADGTPFKRI